MGCDDETGGRPTDNIYNRCRQCLTDFEEVLFENISTKTIGHLYT